MSFENESDPGNRKKTYTNAQEPAKSGGKRLDESRKFHRKSVMSIYMSSKMASF